MSHNSQIKECDVGYLQKCCHIYSLGGILMVCYVTILWISGSFYFQLKRDYFVLSVFLDTSLPNLFGYRVLNLSKIDLKITKI